MSIGDLKIDKKLMMQRELAETFQSLHKTYYMDKFTHIWRALPTVEGLQEGDIVFLKDQTKKYNYPCIGRVTQIKDANAVIT